MRIFVKDGKINFVDENNVVLGYDLDQDCCENADWFIADEPQKNVETFQEVATVKDALETMVRRAAAENPSLEKFVFDPKFFQKIDRGVFEEGGMAIFRIISGRRQRFIHIFNVHNGYYGHGFSFVVGDETTRQGTL